jgi:hypothetical protein
MLLLILWAVLGIPFSVLTLGLFYAVRWIPTRQAQVLVPLVAGIIFVVVSLSMEPPVSGNSEALRFLIGFSSHPLLFVSPMILLHKYLHRIPAAYAVFFAAFIASCVLILTGALQGDLRYGEIDALQFFLKAMITAIIDLIIASAAFGLIIMLDMVLTGTDGENP